MTDLSGALQKALYAALSVVEDLPQVVSEVPVDEDGHAIYPFTLLGDDQVTEIGAKDSRFERHEPVIHVCRQSTTKLVMRADQERVRAALHGQSIEADGTILSAPQALNQSLQLLEDGATYVGSQAFLVFAQDA